MSTTTMTAPESTPNDRQARHPELNQPDPATFYGGDGRGYTDYPALEATGAAA